MFRFETVKSILFILVALCVIDLNAQGKKSLKSYVIAKTLKGDLVTILKKQGIDVDDFIFSNSSSNRISNCVFILDSFFGFCGLFTSMI